MRKTKPLRPGEISKRALFELVGYRPHPGQVPVHRSKARRRVLSCGVRWGKSTCAAMEAVHALLEPRVETRGWVVAPSYELANQVFRRVAYALEGHFKHRVLELDLREQRLEVLNLGGGRSDLRAKTADNPVSLLGEALDFVVVDEAARLRPEVWESHLAQRLIDRKGSALLVSTPQGPGWFHRAFRRGAGRRDPEWEAWSSPSWMNPYLNAEVIEAERSRLPEAVFSQEFGAEFIGVGEEVCETCKGPSPMANSVILLEKGAEPRRCPECGHLVHEDGTTASPLWGDKRGTTTILVLDPVNCHEQARCAAAAAASGGPADPGHP